jgi:hypothetical protein
MHRVVHTHTNTHTRTHTLSHTRTNAHAHTHARTHTRTHTHMRARTHTRPESAAGFKAGGARPVELDDPLVRDEKGLLRAVEHAQLPADAAAQDDPTRTGNYDYATQNREL